MQRGYVDFADTLALLETVRFFMAREVKRTPDQRFARYDETVVVARGIDGYRVSIVALMYHIGIDGCESSPTSLFLSPIMTWAAAAFGLTDGVDGPEHEPFIDMARWPNDLYETYFDAETDEERLQAGTDAITWFLASNIPSDHNVELFDTQTYSRIYDFRHPTAQLMRIGRPTICSVYLVRC